MAKLKLLIFITIILVGYIIITSYNLNLKEKRDQKEFTSLFSKWAYKVTKNVISLVGYTFKQDWNPINNTKNDTKTTN